MLPLKWHDVCGQRNCIIKLIDATRSSASVARISRISNKLDCLMSREQKQNYTNNDQNDDINRNRKEKLFEMNCTFSYILLPSPSRL